MTGKMKLLARLAASVPLCYRFGAASAQAKD